MISFALLLVALVDVSTAQLIAEGPCPNISEVENFDLNKSMGRWHELYNYDNLLEVHQDCIDLHYNMTEGNNFNVTRHAVFRSNQSNNVITLTVNATGSLVSNSSGTIIQTYYIGMFSLPATFYKIIDIDYDSYSVAMQCYQLDRTISFQYIWIMGRNSTLPEKTVDNIKKKLTDKGLDLSVLRKVDQVNCKGLIDSHND